MFGVLGYEGLFLYYLFGWFWQGLLPSQSRVFFVNYWIALDLDESLFVLIV